MPYLTKLTNVKNNLVGLLQNLTGFSYPHATPFQHVS